MPDVVSPAVRSRMMAGIKFKDTKPELTIRRALHRMGYRYRLHVKELYGRPDIVLPRFRAAIFVNGCFWHGHSCHLFKVPDTRGPFWLAKIARNQERDRLVQENLRLQGWRTLTIWECALKGKTRLGIEDVGRMTSHWLKSTSQSEEICGVAT